jgi:hypothetical protein
MVLPGTASYQDSYCRCKAQVVETGVVNATFGMINGKGTEHTIGVKLTQKVHG